MSVLHRLRTVAAFLYDFLIGDDWRVAVLIVAAIVVTVVLAHHGATVWWVPPAALAAGLPYTLWRAIRGSR